MTKSGLALIVAIALLFTMSIAGQIENRVSEKVAQTLAKKIWGDTVMTFSADWEP